jgi:hypothetical protein
MAAVAPAPPPPGYAPIQAAAPERSALATTGLVFGGILALGGAWYVRALSKAAKNVKAEWAKGGFQAKMDHREAMAILGVR